jgi:alkylhydroperoxidase family enzyme
MSIRDAVASQHGADDAILAKVSRYEQSDLPEDQKAALRLADDYLDAPGTLSEEQREDLQRHFSGVQLIEIILRLMQCNSDKTMVALGLDIAEVGRITLERPPS